MKKALFSLILLFAAGVANAQDYPRDFTAEFTNANSYVDGTLMEPGDLTCEGTEVVGVDCGLRFEIYRNNETVPIAVVNFPANGEGLAQTEVLVGVIPRPGTYYVVGYSNVFGLSSDPSNPSTSKKYTGKPLPPTAIRVVAE